MRNGITRSEALTGVEVSIRCECDGVSYGRLVDGIVYTSCGNGWYGDARHEPFPATHYIIDRGSEYRNAIKGDAKQAAKRIVLNGVKI